MSGEPFTPLAMPPKGCICPPTSEATCERPDCGRKPWPGYPMKKPEPAPQSEFTDAAIVPERERMVPRHQTAEIKSPAYPQGEPAVVPSEFAVQEFGLKSEQCWPTELAKITVTLLDTGRVIGRNYTNPLENWGVNDTGLTARQLNHLLFGAVFGKGADRLVGTEDDGA